TRLRMVESGFAAFAESQRIAALNQNNGGWDECFTGLAALLGSADGRGAGRRRAAGRLRGAGRPNQALDDPAPGPERISHTDGPGGGAAHLPPGPQTAPWRSS